jgi:hypothetical protein
MDTNIHSPKINAKHGTKSEHLMIKEIHQEHYNVQDLIHVVKICV